MWDLQHASANETGASLESILNHVVLIFNAGNWFTVVSFTELYDLWAEYTF